MTGSQRTGIGRRTLLRRAGAVAIGVAGAASTRAGARPAGVQQRGGSVTFQDQRSDGATVVIAEVRGPTGARLRLLDGQRTVRAETGLGSAAIGGLGTDSGGGTSATSQQTGVVEEDVEVGLDPVLEEGRSLHAELVAEDGSRLDGASAYVSLDDGEEIVGGTGVQLVEASPADGFNYPYFLFAPSRSAGPARPLLVEPNNTGGATDDFSIHRRLADWMVRYHVPRYLSIELYAPLLVPVFPRPQTDPVDYTHYVHQLDTETMRIDDGPLERVDRQLLAMVEHARGELSAASYPVHEDGIMLDGFSASGNFVNRFAALHPDAVRSVTAGGLNGMAILPIEEARGHTLNYQIGIADLESLTGEPFDPEAFRSVDQLLYMGAEDDNDTIPYDDAWSPEQREVALDVYGEDMLQDRFPYCESVYDEVDASARFQVYEDTGHEVTSEILADVAAFHRERLPDGGGGGGGGNDGGGVADALPGPGIGGAIGGLAGGAYLLRLTGDRDDGEDSDPTPSAE